MGASRCTIFGTQIISCGVFQYSGLHCKGESGVVNVITPLNATILASSHTGDQYFVILGASLLPLA